MSQGLIASLIIGGMVWAGIGFILFAHCELEADDAPWWPIYLVKALSKSLVRALFTGWRS